MNKATSKSKLSSTLLHVIIILIFALLITIASYGIVTRRNVPMDPRAVAVGQYSITGEYLVTLPCGYPNYDSSSPRLPEARGVPFNYNYYNPCDGHKILRNGFLMDVGFWTIIFGSLSIAYNVRRHKGTKLVH